MSKFRDKLPPEGFSVEGISLTELEEIEGRLPRNGIIDINIAESGLVCTLEGQNLCQEIIVQLDTYIGRLESEKNMAWSEAALNKSKTLGHKTIKDKEWYAQSDDAYVGAYNRLTMAKACKKWFENKAGYFSGWHYAFKTFLRRDYSIENATSLNVVRYNDSGGSRPPTASPETSDNDDDWGEVSWE